MPYVNKLNVRGTQFDIRDEEARTEIEALKKKIAQLDNPNSRFELKYTGIVLANDTDVTNFVNSYNPTTNYGDLAVGNVITIQDGTYNKDWIIAGFNMYEIPTVTDSTISLLPLLPLGTYDLANEDPTNFSYSTSKVHNEMLQTVYDNMSKNMPSLLAAVANVTSSSTRTTLHGSVDDFIFNGLATYSSNSSQYWLYLMSEIQILGSRTVSNFYDSGFGQYQFPLFKHVILPMLPYYIKYYCDNSIGNFENMPSRSEYIGIGADVLGSATMGLRDVSLGSNVGLLTWDPGTITKIPNSIAYVGEGSINGEINLFPEINIRCYVTGFGL